MKIAKFLFLICIFVQNVYAADWKEYSPQGGRCSVLVPKDPALCVKSVPTAYGPINLYQVILDYGDHSYLLAFADYPDPVFSKTPDQILDDVVIGNAQNGQLISHSRMNLGTYPGRSYVVHVSGFEVRGAIYLVNKRLYQMVTVYSFEMAQSLTQEVDTFLNSLKLVESYDAPNDALYNCASEQAQAGTKSNSRNLAMNQASVAFPTKERVIMASSSEKEPDSADDYNKRGMEYENKGQLKEAIADYSKAIELNPKFQEAYANRARAYQKMSELDQKKAKELKH